MANSVMDSDIVISAPRFSELVIKIRGTAPYVQNKFSVKARAQIKATQESGSQAKSKKVREAKDFQKAFEDAQYLSREGWHGIPASSFRKAMVSACKTIGFKMTHAKQAIFVEADGFDADDGLPLIRISGKPRYTEMPVRNDNGSIDLRARPMFLDGWTAQLRIRFDEDLFSAKDVYNLLLRAGIQVGIGEGRPDSKDSCGMGWGTFTIEE